MGPLVYGLLFGFIAFAFIGMGLLLIIDSAMASKKNKEN
jgi:hypothetical protein